MIHVSHKGDFHKTMGFLNRCKKLRLENLKQFGEAGVEALRRATPKDTGKTADSWYYEIEKSPDDSTISIHWKNSNVQNYVNIAVILQLGHATGTGGWVDGRDYINPAIQPIFDKIAKGAWKEVTGR